MDFFSVLTLIGGIAFFLFGMSLMGNGLEKVSGRQNEDYSRKNDQYPAQRGAVGRFCNRRDSILLGNDGDGGGLCQFGNYEPFSGDWYYYGRKYRHDRHRLAAFA